MLASGTTLDLCLLALPLIDVHMWHRSNALVDEMHYDPALTQGP